MKKHLNSDDGRNYMTFWLFETPVDSSFVTDNKLYDSGISTYSWTERQAYRLMYKGTALIERNNTFYHVYKEYFMEGEQHSMNGFDHFHVYCWDRTGVLPVRVRVKNGKIEYAHSFFGPMYLRNFDDPLNGEPTRYPEV